MDHTHCTCGAVIPECCRLHVDDVEWDSLVTEPVSVTEEVTEEPPVEVDVDVDVHVEEESSHEESESEHESEHESDHAEDEGEGEGESTASESEVVVEADTGMPELDESERHKDEAHPLPMMRG